MTTDEEIILYGHPRSGNVYKAALMLALTNTPFSFHEIDVPGGEQKSDAYLAINPLGKVPALRHGETVIRQSNTILLYLASLTKQFGARDQAHRLRISEWLFWEQDQMFWGIGRTRFLSKFVKGDPAVVEFLRSIGSGALDALEHQLEASPFLTGDAPTIADVAVYAYARLAEEAGLTLNSRPQTAAWRGRMEVLPGWGTPEALLS